MPKNDLLYVATIIPISMSEFTASPEVAELLREYEAESNIHGMPPINPDWDAYSRMEQAGSCRLFSACVESKIVGFVMVGIVCHPYYRQLVCSTMSYFVSQKYRKTGAGLRLLEEAETAARSAGCVVMLSASHNGTALEEVLPRRGYSEETKTWFKTL